MKKWICKYLVNRVIEFWDCFWNLLLMRTPEVLLENKHFCMNSHNIIRFLKTSRNIYISPKRKTSPFPLHFSQKFVLFIDSSKANLKVVQLTKKKSVTDCILNETQIPRLHKVLLLPIWMVVIIYYILYNVMYIFYLHNSNVLQ